MGNLCIRSKVETVEPANRRYHARASLRNETHTGRKKTNWGEQEGRSRRTRHEPRLPRGVYIVFKVAPLA